MRFTKRNYEEAIENLKAAMEQLEPDGRNCAICGDSGHQAFECGHNPLFAVRMCQQIAEQAEELHQTLHSLAGWNQAFGEQLGPKKVTMPGDSELVSRECEDCGGRGYGTNGVCPHCMGLGKRYSVEPVG